VGIAKSVADAANRLDSHSIRVQFATQAFDVAIDRTLEDQISFGNCAIQELRSAKRTAGLAQKAFQQPEFRRRQIDSCPV
jgi:hypothetical protein